MTLNIDVDVCIYGGTSAGVTAAVQARRSGLSVVVLHSGAFLGGLSAGGLGFTDVGNQRAVGGIAREFYKRVGKAYGVVEEWRFEPHVAEQVFKDFIAETDTPVYYNVRLRGLSKANDKITSIVTESGDVVSARAFIDASYEGDLMALAGVSFHIGRESNSTYGETLNGAQIHHSHQFNHPVSPYVVEGVPGSGLLPGIEDGPLPVVGEGDHRVQAYNYRMCLTKVPDNRMPFPKPLHYDRAWYVLLARYYKTGWNETFRKYDPIRNNKTDTNNHGAVSTDFIGQNFAYPNATWAERLHILDAHKNYQQGLMWFLANDPEVPQDVRDAMNEWGLPRDEFKATGGWPHQLYIREARRMVTDVVMTEHHCRGTEVVDDAVGLGAYGMDSHNCRRYVLDGQVRNEGDVQVHGFPPYRISYRSIVPRKHECTNLVVPVCAAASHIAYGSIRMEPVFMVLGQSAAVAAQLAIQQKVALQDVPYSDLGAALTELGQILVPPPKAVNTQLGI
ncbi:MAG: FAD-dependent oxidoreductase [Candidatus Methylacidiphilales bacterium]